MECGDIQKYYGDRLLIDLKNLKVYSDDRIGIVGLNGCGKTTLINILTKQLQPDQGWVKLYTNYSCINQMGEPEKKMINSAIAAQFEVGKVWSDNMSGGEQSRFKLAAALEGNQPLLFADEPTSNVDIEGIEMMEAELSRYPGALLLISHDRILLDRLCNKILEIESGQVRLYRGNFSKYHEQKRQEVARKQLTYQQYVDEKKRLEKAAAQVRQQSGKVRKTPRRMGNSEARLHKMGDQKAKASLDKAARSLETKIAQLESVGPPVKTATIKLDLQSSGKIHRPVVMAGSGMNKSYGDRPIFMNAGFILGNGTKTALIGPNGCGKSTLLKMIIAGDESIQIAPAAKIGYFSQDLRILNHRRTVLENVLEGCVYDETFVRTLLARLLFKGDDVYKPAGVLSGGEQVKAAFARIITRDINLLLLDEPTNYMDIDSLEAVEDTLAGYDRTLLFVSHDRKFINKVADHIMIIENHAIKMLAGTYADYMEKRKESPDSSAEDLKSRILALQHRLDEIVGKLSIPSKKDDLPSLDREYHVVLEELKELKSRLQHFPHGG